MESNNSAQHQSCKRRDRERRVSVCLHLILQARRQKVRCATDVNIYANVMVVLLTKKVLQVKSYVMDSTLGYNDETIQNRIAYLSKD